MIADNLVVVDSRSLPEVKVQSDQFDKYFANFREGLISNSSLHHEVQLWWLNANEM